jgi:cytochrome b involved in lipid metabolism
MASSQLLPLDSTAASTSVAEEKKNDDTKPLYVADELGISEVTSLRRQKVPLGPGYSQLHWMNLMNKLPIPQYKQYTKEELSQHATKESCWLALNGRVYDCTHYLKFHPGGVEQIMRGAGKDATRMFTAIHSFVNYSFMLERCCVGTLVDKKST